MGRARYTLGREPKKACERKTRTGSDRIRVVARGGGWGIFEASSSTKDEACRTRSPSRVTVACAYVVRSVPTALSRSHAVGAAESGH